MNYLEIEAFLAIIDTQSISKAAEKLYVSQSTISNRLNALENEIEEKLIIRAKGIKTIELTPKGKEFTAFANRYISFIKDLDKWKYNSSKYELKIGSPPSLNAYLLLDLYSKIIDTNYPLVLKITSHWNDTIYNLLESFSLDIGIVSRSFTSKNLITTPIFFEKMVMISNKQVSDYKQNINANSLNISDEIYLDWGPEFEMWHNHIWSPIEIPKLIVDLPNLIEYFLNIKDSWAIVPLSVAITIYKRGNIQISDINPYIPNRTIYKIVQREPNPSSKTALNTFENELNDFISSNKHLIKIE